MKKSALFVIVALLSVFSLKAAPVFYQDIFEEIAFAVKSGDSKALSKYFSSMVEITINNEENIYSNKQAEQVLKSFFTKNQPQNFTIRHKGSSAKGLPYIIGDFQSSTGHFRTYILFKEINGKQYIQEMQFDKE